MDGEKRALVGERIPPSIWFCKFRAFATMPLDRQHFTKDKP